MILSRRIQPERYRVHLFALVLFAAGVVSPGGTAWGDVQNGWEALLANKPLEAEQAFLQVSEDSPEIVDALDGLVLCRWLLGDAAGMREGWLSLLQLSGAHSPNPHSWWGGYLTSLKAPELRGHDREATLEALNIVHSLRNLSDGQRHAVLGEIAALEEQLPAPPLEDHLAKLGVVRDWWYVAGPFGESGDGDLDVAFPPEEDLWADSWEVWLGSVKPVALDAQSEGALPPDKGGRLRFSDLTRPEGPVAYAVTVLQGTRGGTARLTIETESDVRVWWDGVGVLEKDMLRHTVATRLETEVPMRRGPILLVVKVLRRGPWSVRVRVDDPEGLDPPWVPAVRGDATVGESAVLPFSVAFEKTSRGGDVADSIAAAGDGLAVGDVVSNPRANLLEALYRVISAADARRIRQARAYLQRLRELSGELGSPGWVFPDLLEANLDAAEAKARGRSSTRLLRQARENYRAALTRCPQAVNAVVGLVGYFLQRDQVDQALELVDSYLEETWSSSGRPVPHILHSVLGSIYARKGWNLRARKMFLSAHESGWPYSAALYDQLASYAMADGRPGEALKWMEEGLTRFPTAGALLGRLGSLPPGCLASHKDAGSQLRAIVEAHLPFHPMRFAWRQRAVHLQRLQGDVETAKLMAEQAVADLPNNGEARQLLASIQTYTHPDQVEASLTAYQDALALTPWDPGLRKSVRALQDVDGSAAPQFYEPYDIRLEDLDLSPADQWNNTRAGSVFLIDLNVLQLQPEGTYRQYIHQAARIINEEGRSAWAEHVIPAGVDLLIARTISPDGTIWPVDHIKPMQGSQALSFFEVREGSIIEYAYEQPVHWNRSPGRNVYVGSNGFGDFEKPMLLSKLVVLVPPGVEPEFQWADEEQEPQVGPDGALPTIDGYSVHIWEFREREGVKQESFAPPLARLVPMVSIRTAKRWEPSLLELAAFMQRGREPGPWSDALLVEIGLSHTDTDRQKVERIVAWVREEIQDGSGSATARDAAELRTGSAASKLLLAEALLTAAGLDALPALVLPITVSGAQDADGFGPHPGNSLGLPQLLRVVLRDEGNGVVYVDPADRYAAPFYLSAEVRSSIALVLDVDGFYAEPVNAEVWKGGWVRNYFDVHLNTDRSSSVKGRVDYDGSYRQAVIGLAKNAEAKERFTRQVLGNALRGLVVELSALEGVENTTGHPSLTFQGTLPEHQRTPTESTGGASSLDREFDLCPNPSELSGRLIREVTRTTPVAVEGALAYQPLEIAFDFEALLPQGLCRPELPQDVLLLNRFGVFVLSSRIEGSTIRVRRSLLIPPLHIPPRLYGEFAEFCRRVDEYERVKIRLHPFAEAL